MILKTSFLLTLAAAQALTGSLAAAENAPHAPGVAPVVFGFEEIPLTATNAARIAGKVLLNELGCANCHQSPGSSAELETKRGPDLRQTRTYRPGYLEAWLAAPNQVKPGTTMPDLLSALSPREREQTAADLAAFLRTLPPSHVESASLGTPNSADGAALYHSIGCVACHAPAQAPPADSAAPGDQPTKLMHPSVPLGRLADKYTVESLAEFLMNPLSRRPSARMPSFNLNPTNAGNLAAWLIEKGPPSGAPIPANRPIGDPASGGRYFQSLRCAACHTISDGAPRIAMAPALSAVHWDSPGGCLASEPVVGLPHFAVSNQQRESLRVAVSPAPPLTKHETIIARVAEMGCAACHRRDGTGGPEPARAAFFTGTGEDLGDEGRFPPSLDHVGYKLIQPALADTIAHGTRLRPYLKTRMPAFGVPTAAPLAESLESCDVPENLPVLNQKGRNEAGRKLLGSSGLSCIACHAINGHKSLGISAMDLTRTIGRLRPEWLVDFLKNPADFTPGTRMPSFWSNVKREKMWGEVDAIRVYLLESDQSRLPEGMNSTQSYELIPSQRPIIFRSFITGAGTQAIGVGFPEGLNIAFDAEASNWALAWKGRFLDAEGTWFDRMNPPAVPLGTEVLTFGGGPPLARLKNDRETWPDTPRGYGNVRYLGYHLDARGYPTFRYRVDGTEVTDRIEPSHDGRTLNRELTWPAGKGVLFARIASAPSVIATEPGRCRVADRWNLTLLTPGPERLQIRNSPDGKSKEAILAVSSETELNRIRYRIQW